MGQTGLRSGLMPRSMNPYPCIVFAGGRRRHGMASVDSLSSQELNVVLTYGESKEGCYAIFQQALGPLQAVGELEADSGITGKYGLGTSRYLDPQKSDPPPAGSEWRVVTVLHKQCV